MSDLSGYVSTSETIVHFYSEGLRSIPWCEECEGYKA
jgi:hypothetical protein